MRLHRSIVLPIVPQPFLPDSNTCSCRSSSEMKSVSPMPAKDSICDESTVVVVPCFNEAGRLEVSAYSDFVAQSPNITILFVDDGSTDDTPLILERLRQQHPRQIATLRLAENIGKGEAVRRGFQAAYRRSPAIVGYLDADLAAPLTEIPHLLEVFRQRPHVQVVIGSRVALLGRSIQRSGWRHLLGRCFATAASTVLRLPVYDTQCGAKLFRATPVTAELFAEPFASRWIFDVEILARIVMRSAGRAESPSLAEMLYECPLNCWRDVHGSRLKLWDFVVAARDLVTIRSRYLRKLKIPSTATVSVADVRQSKSPTRDAA